MNTAPTFLADRPAPTPNSVTAAPLTGSPRLSTAPTRQADRPTPHAAPRRSSSTPTGSPR